MSTGDASPCLTPNSLSTLADGLRDALKIAKTPTAAATNEATASLAFTAPDKTKMTPEAFYLANKIPLSPTLESFFKEFEKDGPAQCDKVAELAVQAGWKDSGVKNGVKLAMEQKLKIYRGSIEIEHEDATPEALMNWLWTQSPRNYDDGVEASCRIFTYQEDYPGLLIYLQSNKGQMGFSGRDFMLSSTRKQYGDDHGVFASKSVALPELDAPGALPGIILNGRVRADTSIGGMDIRRSKNAAGKNILTVTYLHNADPKVNVMQIILNQILLNSCLFLAQLKKAFIAYLTSKKEVN